MSAHPVILTLNSGSSSLKFALFCFSAQGELRIADGGVERIGLGGGRFWIHPGAGAPLKEKSGRFADVEAALECAFEAIDQWRLPTPHAVGHRIVHGGPDHERPELVDRALVESLRRVVPFAPLHLPAELRAIEIVAARYPELPQVACFDTAFFRTLPELARRFPLPRALHDQGVRRYGFHGISYEYLVESLGADAAGRSVFAHLGSGASLVAVRDGQPLDTTMGLTPSAGIMMGTRTGDLDPGILLYLLDAGYGARELGQIINRESGLLGVSGTSSEMTVLLERRARDEWAALAFEMFAYQVKKAIGAFTAALGGIESLVFTGAIGRHAAPVRERICAGLECLGICLDRSRNRESNEVISTDDSRCIVRVIATDEELMIARHTRRRLFPRSAGGGI
jgi:acetate kinase